MQAAFESAAVDNVLKAPGAAGMWVLCDSCEVRPSADDEIQTYMLNIGKDANEDWTQEEFFGLLVHLGWSDTASVAAADAVPDFEAQIIAQSTAVELFEVKPTQVLHTALHQDSADLCKLVEEMKFDPAVIASKHEAMFAKFMSSNQSDDELPLEMRRARYSRQFYYPNVRRALLEQILVTRNMPRQMVSGRFVPLVSTFTPDGEVRKEEQALVGTVVVSDIDLFERLFLERWDPIARSLQYCEGSVKEIFAKFAEKEYFTLLREAVSKRPRVFVPKFAVDCNGASPTEQLVRQDLLKAMDEGRADELDCALREAWEAHLAGLSPYVQNYVREGGFDRFEQSKYFDCMASLVTAATHTSEFTYIPALQPRDADERALVDRVTSPLAQEIDLELAQRWTAEVEGIEEYMRDTVPKLPSPSFLNAHFFDVLRSVLRRSSDAKVSPEAVVSKASSWSHPSDERFTSDQIMAQLLSRPSSAQSRGSEATKARYVGAMQLQTDNFGYDDILKYEGYLVSDNVATRSVTVGKQDSSPKKRGREPAKDTKVVDVYLVDPTGPVFVSLWGDLATTLEDLMAEFLRKHPPPSTLRPIVVLENVRAMKMVANEWNGTLVTPMKHLQTVRAVGGFAPSQLSFAETPTSPFMRPAPFQKPPPSVVLSRFSSLEQTPAPFRVSVRGVVVDVGVLEITGQGNPKKSFKLVDEVGSWVSCVAFGDEARKSVIDECTEMVLFFASGRGAKASSEGALFVFQNSCVMAFGKVKERPALRGQVDIS